MVYKFKILLLFVLFIPALSAQQSEEATSKQYAKLVRKTEKKLLKQYEKAQRTLDVEDENETPDLYWLQQYLATMDPSVGRPTPEALFSIFQHLEDRDTVSRFAMPGSGVTPWVERGPNNVGGRTRALVYDPTDASNKKVWAGGITGGLWYNSDITNANTSWIQVNSLWSNMGVSAIAFDPNTPGTMYVGTGEGYGATPSTSRGFGIWKSTDTGRTFTQLAATTSYFYVTDMVVRNESGSSVLYVTVDANFFGGQWNGLSSYGLFKSTNGGTSFTNIAPNAPNSQKYAFGDLEIAADNTLYAGTKSNAYSGSDKGGGRVMKYNSGSSWTTLYTNPNKGRVELACAPGSAGLIYALFESGGKADTIMVTHNFGSTWTAGTKPDDADLGISKWDFTRGQGWYNLILAVDPNDTNVVVVGGIDIFRSTNGCSSWSQISKWANNPNLNTLSCSYVHADIHAIVFKPGSSSTCIFGTDGGVFYTSQLSVAANNNVIADRNKNYNVTQFYWGDMAATSGSNLMIAGAQDNGTQKFTSSGVNSTTLVKTGDGAACFISPSNSNKQVASYVYNNYEYTTNNWGSKADLIADGATGSFINPADWDDNGPGLFTAKTSGNIYRRLLTSGPGTLQTISWSASGSTTSVNAFKLSSGKSRLFVGTDAGKLYKTDDAWATTPSFTNITGTINVGSISDVDDFKSGDTIAVTLSNYGVNNIYISTNGGSSWAARDGNLDNQPVWSIILNPNKVGEAVIATETGVYGTSNIFTSSPVWTAYTSGMGAVKIATLRYRASDKMLMAVTHGRGVFTSDAWGKNTPIAYFGADKRAICSNQSVAFKDSSANDPTQWEWSVTPANHYYVNGTDSSSQNPIMKFKTGGTYAVTLKAANQLGAGQITRSSFITVTDTIAGIVTITASKDTLCNGDSLLLTSNIASSLNGSITNYSWELAGNTTNNTKTSMKVLPTVGQWFRVTLTSNAACVSPNPFTSVYTKPIVLPVVKPTLSLTAPPTCTDKNLDVTASGTNLGSNPVYQWFVIGILQSETSNKVAVTGPSSGLKVWAKVEVPGKCVFPSNTIVSDTLKAVVFTKPTTPVVSRNFDTLFATGGAGTFAWYRNGVFSGNGKSYRAPQNGSYKCIYTENGCSSDSSGLLVFNSLSVSPEWLNSTSVWPIPTEQVLHVSSATQITEMQVYSLDGKLMKTGFDALTSANPSAGSKQQYEINVKDLTPGSYILKLMSGSDSGVFPFIKQ